VAIKVIVELQAKPGRRAELKSLLESMVAELGPSQRGFLGSTRYEVLDDPDMLIEIAEWESAEARVAHIEESAATGAYAPLLEMLAAHSERRLSGSCLDHRAFAGIDWVMRGRRARVAGAGVGQRHVREAAPSRSSALVSISRPLAPTGVVSRRPARRANRRRCRT
jgi:quinol monooxygenase YgiN